MVVPCLNALTINVKIQEPQTQQASSNNCPIEFEKDDVSFDWDKRPDEESLKDVLEDLKLQAQQSNEIDIHSPLIMGKKHP